ncbi:hypothetical protein HUK76_21630 [Citrobacter portucalensis]|uniref:hypothetical protein n=1 Tax=Citrobacter portucalensis TaxID=1639133 RepID=UPI0015805EDE|nr:hypothetical protein [Citrobacter portucalensis]NUH56256.1 hypothetical protein [Citrobacter portucalensis]
MRDLYFKTLTHAENALSYSENMRQILFTWLDGLSDRECDARDSNLAGALITLLDPVIKELNKIEQLHEQNVEHHSGK